MQVKIVVSLTQKWETKLNLWNETKLDEIHETKLDEINKTKWSKSLPLAKQNETKFR
jgi:hypothetical protein